MSKTKKPVKKKTDYKQAIGKFLAIVSAGIASFTALAHSGLDTLNAVIVAVSAITAALSTSPIQSVKNNEK